jgi:acyl carrier protein
MNELKEKLKSQIIQQLNLEHLSLADIKDEAPLFGPEGLGLDSIDALEFIVLLDTNYGIKISDPGEARSIFYSVDTMFDFISKNGK